MSKIYPFSLRGDNTLKFVKIDVVDEDYSEDRYNYSVDYSKVDIGLIHRPPVGDEVGGLAHKVIIDGKSVGFIEMGQFKGLDGPKGIENVYVKPDYRGFGVAERIYRHAIENYNVHVMSISYHRVMKPRQIKYWNSVGFVKVALIPGQTGKGKSLCHLLTKNARSLDLPGSFALDYKGVKRCSDHSRRIVKKIFRLTGTGLDRANIPANIEFLERVVGNHFGNREVA
tara:strand:- start:146 stop:826 length:681 start_codon:yes stop_codon:yes gene_type:complete